MITAKNILASISVTCTSLLLTIGMPANAQEKKNEQTNNAEKVKVIQHIAISADLIGPIQMAVSDYGQYEAQARFDIKDKFYAAGEETVRKINEKTNCKAKIFDLADKDALREEIASSYLLANATGVGMKPLEGQTWLPDASYLRPDLIVTDTVYAPAETEFLRIAKEVGCKQMNGFGMMLFQGAAAFKMWTGHDMPIEHMKEVLGIRYGE